MFAKKQAVSNFRYILILLVSLVFISFFQPFYSEAGTEVIWLKEDEVVPEIYLIAVGNDAVKGFSNKYSKNDAASFADEIEKRTGDLYTSKNTKLITPRKYKVHKTLLLDSQATREAIIGTLDSVAKDARSDDIFIFHYAGHGGMVESGDYLLATFDYDAKKRDTELLKERQERSISGELLKAYFSRIRAGTKMLVFDTGISSFVCEQGDSFFSKSGGNSLFIGTKTSSMEIPKKEHGTVTGILLDALNGNADSNYDGVVNAWEVLAYFGNVKNDENRIEELERNVKFCTSTQGTNFDITLTNKRLDEIRAKTEKEKPSETNTSDNTSKQPDADRADIINGKKPVKKVKKREGNDYALLFAFDDYDKNWTKLANPRNDVRDVAAELQNRYKFKEVVIKENLTLEQFNAVIEDFKKRKFNEDDQLFVFFAGHGIASQTTNNGFLVASDSLPPSAFEKRRTDSFIKLDDLLGDIDEINSKHIMLVFDACYAGRIWEPSYTLVRDELAFLDIPLRKNPARSFSGFPVFGFQSSDSRISSFDDDKLSKDEMISRELENISRVVLTSGHDVVSDGKPGTNSPFAKRLLEALRDGADKDGLLTLPDIMRYVKRAKNRTPAELGRIDKQGEKSSGGFVFCQGGC